MRCASYRCRRNDDGTTGSQQKSKTPFRGSVPSDEISCVDRVALACLTSAFRPQGFPPSRRLNPDATLRLCFAPHPPVGFLGLKGCSLIEAPARLSTYRAPPPRGCAARPGKPDRATAGLLSRPAAGKPEARALHETRQPRTSEQSSGRASDTPHHAETWRQAAALSTFSPSGVREPERWAEALPSCAWARCRCGRQAGRGCSARGTTGYQSARAWGSSRRSYTDPHEVCHVERQILDHAPKSMTKMTVPLGTCTPASRRRTRFTKRSPYVLGAEP